jgi:hypothetical protein
VTSGWQELQGPPAPYTVKPGENPASIARAHCLTLGEFFSANPSLVSDDSNREKKLFVNPGDTVNIPPGSFNPALSPAAAKLRCAGPLDTVCEYVKRVKTLEAAHTDWKFDAVLNSLRHTAVYDDPNFQQMYNLPETPRLEIVPWVSAEDIGVLRTMSQHGGDTPDKETGMAPDSTDRMVAIGHTLTGMAAGRRYNPNVSFGVLAFCENVDNLYATTLAGDLGQYAVLLSLGTPAATARMDATASELTGDVDGFVLGSMIQSGEIPITDATKVSDVLGKYYGCDGGANPLNRSRFSELNKRLDPARLTDQVRRFGTTYLYAQGSYYYRGMTTRKSTMDPFYESANRYFQNWLRRESAAEAATNAPAAPKPKP